MPIPTWINRREMAEAIKPLCDLLGTSPKNFFDSPGIKIGDGEITFLVPVRHEDEPTGRAPSLQASKGAPDEWPPHPQGAAPEAVLVGDLPEATQWAYAVRVEVRNG